METEQNTKKTQRRMLPTDRDFYSRDKLNRVELHVQLPNIKEAVRVRDFTKQEINALSEIKEKERQDYSDFCERYPDFEGIFHAQRTKKIDLSKNQISALDYIQNIKNSKIRLIHQRKVTPQTEEAIKRIEEFEKAHPNTKNIPLIDMEMAGKNKATRKSLRDILIKVIQKRYKNLAFIYRGNKPVVKAWHNTFKPLLLKHIIKKGGSVYIIQVPTKARKYFAIANAFYMGATKVSLKRGKPFQKVDPLFLEPNAELRTLDNTSEGVVKYGAFNRLQFLQQDRRKSYVGFFARWDRLVQTNELCRTKWSVDDLTNIPELVQVIRYFS